MLKKAFATLNVVSIASTIISAWTPVAASIRRTPAAIADSETILKKPICPVAAACVPPQSSHESPNFTTRTLSPYFSPKSAIAPISCASSMVALRFSSRGLLALMRALTRFSTRSICSSESFSKCEKSKRKYLSHTNEPFCSTCVPRISRRA